MWAGSNDKDDNRMIMDMPSKPRNNSNARLFFRGLALPGADRDRGVDGAMICMCV